ncbi:hypothetical protein DP939_45145 [Spongiactinospora rosea]|uniref:Uncharacterized protein n=1 Tax=Spongiactinospora rosea TaxID=2248750 RepID=A0A366LCJ4_9ACTN|nr:hypothetical protein DP939_45145 [Spongiactinospora rosea]
MAEGVLRRRMGQRELAGVPSLITDDCAATADRISGVTGRWGVKVTLLEVTIVQLPLRGELPAQAQARARGQRERHPWG